MSSNGLAALLVLAATPLGARADDAAITARAGALPAKLGPGEAGVLSVHIEVPPGWHLWSLDPGEGPQALSLTLQDAPGIVLSGPWYGPEPHRAHDRGFDRELARYDSGGAPLRFERRFLVDAAAAAGARAGTVLVRGQICTEETCLSQRVSASLTLEIAPARVGIDAVDPQGVALTERAPSAAPPRASVAASPAATPGSGAAATAAIGASALPSSRAPGSLWQLILTAFLAGLAALATPCVFPAIPLTVSFFSKYSEERLGRGALLAAFYAASMVACFTFAGVALSVVLGATGIQQFAAHPVFNLGLALVLVFFSLNLLGMFEIQAPAFVLDFTNRLENKYGPASRGGAKGGLGDFIAVGVAAVTATTVFFTCTVAFVGTVVVAAADGEWFYPTIGMLAFAAAFVMPFFLLALFPQAARRLRGKSGNWLVVTRVTLGFVELAAAAKFFSNADLVWRTNLLTRDAVLALWVSLFALCGMFLLGKLRMGEEQGEDEASISVPRMLISAVTFSFTLYLALGLFTGRPLGWVDGWLPPATFAGEASAATGSRAAPPLSWRTSLPEGRQAAAAAGQLVFVNYTGYTCTNCRYMESSVFTRPEIRALLESMVRVELYTDGLDAESESARADQVARFKTAALPFYAIERPDGTVLATFPSSTNDPEEFRRFLADALERGSAAQPAAPPLKLATQALVGGQPASAIAPGQWTLINFWATWCGPCRAELEAFLADVGKEVHARGGRFAAVTVDDPDALDEALAFMRKVGVPDGSAFRLGPPLDASTVDARLGFDGSTLPTTILVAPDGHVAWRHQEALTREQLEAVLAQHMGYAALR